MGDISNETFLRILSEGQGIDHVIAISVLSTSELPQIRERIFPFLHSTNSQERWVSAIVLGAQQEHAALPVLINMLTEYFPAWIYDKELDNPTWFEENRLRIPPLLDSWDNTSLVVPLRQALIASLAIQQTWAASIGMLRPSLRFYQDALMVSLGRRGAFGVLAGLTLPAEIHGAFVVHMVIGYCRIKEDGRFLNHVWERDAQVREAMTRVMEQQFGLSTQEQYAYLEQYARYMSALDDVAGL